ncbi:MAG: 30S ribosomal protein S4e [Crenarchaeota archaeon]|nr:30S ribosomal protein S4e [Thermoproteota archaeon]
MVKRHLRRSCAPWWWPIPRKAGGVWTVRPHPGPHPLEKSLPLAIIVRDVLRYAKTLKEARRIISMGYIKVDGRVRRDYKYPVGLMDVIEIVPTGELYRMVPHPVKFLTLVPISREEASIKPCRIENKTTIKGGYIQLNLHDGRNHIVSPEEAAKYRTLDTVVLTIPEQSIIKHIPIQLGSLVVIIDGKNVGKIGRIVEVIQTFKRRRATVAIETEKGEIIRTILEYVMPIGEESKPIITLPQECY